MAPLFIWLPPDGAAMRVEPEERVDMLPPDGRLERELPLNDPLLRLEEWLLYEDPLLRELE